MRLPAHLLLSCLCVVLALPTGAQETMRRVAVELSAAGPPGDFTLTARAEPNSDFQFTLRLSDLRCRVLDSAGQPTGITLPVALQSERLRGGLTQSYGDPPEQSVRRGLHIPLDTLKSGLYSLSLPIGLTAVKDSDGQPISLPDAEARLRLFVAPAPEKKPALTPGQRFLYFPNESHFGFRSRAGKSLTVAQTALKVFTLRKVEGADDFPVLTFTIEGLPGDYFLGASVNPLHDPGLYPIVEDETVRRLRAKYQGKQVWGYGGLGAAVVSDRPNLGGGIGLDNDKPVRIKRLFRISGKSVPMNIGSHPGVGGDLDYDSSFVCVSPIVALLDLPRAATVTALAFSGGGKPGEMERLTQTPQAAALGFYALFADAWDFERAYSLVSPQKARANWPPALRRMAAAGELKIGMTPEMVGWILGWPNDYATIAQMKTAHPGTDIWEYDTLPPFHFLVTFHNGKVTAFGDDGRLP